MFRGESRADSNPSRQTALAATGGTECFVAPKTFAGFLPVRCRVLGIG